MFFGGMHFINVVSCAGWVSASSGIIVVNRIMLVELDLPYPMAVAALGMLASCVFAYTAGMFFEEGDESPGITPILYLTCVIPIGFCQASAMWLSNYA